MWWRSPASRGVFVALAGATAVVLVVVALDRPSAAEPHPPAPILGTPLWSVRRAPGLAIDAVGAERLTTALTEIAGGNDTCVSVEDTGGPLVRTAPDQALVPASTLKLLTAAAALDALGPRSRFRTEVRGSGPVRSGEVDQLFLVGGGDPLLATPERIALDARDPETGGLATTPLAGLADAIAAAGVRSVPGGVVGVDGAYDDTPALDTWSAGAKANIGPVGALTVNDGFAGADGTGGPVDDPAVNAAAELARLLAARGVDVGPASRAASAPAGDAIAHVDSPPLTDVLTEMLSASDNLTAEMLVRTLGARPGAAVGGATAGTTAAGVNEVRDRLTRLGIDLGGAVVLDGSGLSADNRLRCPTLVQVLDLATRPRFRTLGEGLAVAGSRGTLATELRGTPLADNLRAKTGTLSGVSALAGFVHADRPLTFSLMLRGGFGEERAFALREAMASAIAGYPDVGDTAASVPAPIAPIPSRA